MVEFKWSQVKGLIRRKRVGKKFLDGLKWDPFVIRRDNGWEVGTFLEVGNGGLVQRNALSLR